MTETKIIAMYLPQYHETEMNNRSWGKGFTDWVSVKTAAPLYEGHRQPRVPKDQNYYDLTDVQTLRWQAELARKHGVYGFGIYHYWFSTNLQTLTKPAELLLENPDIDIPFFFAWDNNTWTRTWSRLKHNANAWSPKIDQQMQKDENPDGILAKLEYGTEEDWKAHFDYLNRFFSDKRYIKVNNKPLFIVWNYTQKETLAKMCAYWQELARQAGYDGLYLVSRLNPYDSMEGFDALFTYEPMFSAWQNRNLVNRVYNKLADMLVAKRKMKCYDYDRVWKSILKNARRHEEANVLFGGFVDYDDTPRRGTTGKVVKGGSPEKFGRYLSELLKISRKQGKEFVFITAWNEWGEGAYLEPDELTGNAYLQTVKKVLENVDD